MTSERKRHLLAGNNKTAFTSPYRTYGSEAIGQGEIREVSSFVGKSAEKAACLTWTGEVLVPSESQTEIAQSAQRIRNALKLTDRKNGTPY